MRRGTGSPRLALWFLALAPLRGGAAAPSLTAEPDRSEEGQPAASRSLDWRGWQRDLALRVLLDKKSAFPGEQVTATVELLSPVEVVDWDAWHPPALDGFWSEDLGAKPSRRIETIGGVPLRVYVLKKLALFPRRSGSLTVEAAELEVRVQIASRDPLGLSPEMRRARRQSRPVKLEVKPLPAGAPAGFEPGNVGEWSLTIEVPQQRPPAGQPFPVRLAARGTGNLRALALPGLPATIGLRAFEPSVTDEVTLRGNRFGGMRTVETLVALEREGAVLLPGSTWPYFDPRTGRYEVRRLPEVRLEAGPPPPEAPGGVAGAAALAGELRPLRTDGAPEPARGPAFRSPLFIAGAVLPPAGFLAAAALRALSRRRRRTAVERRRAGAAGLARRRLAGARARLAAGDAVAACEEVARALRGYAEDVLGRPAGALTSQALAREISRAGAPGPAAGLLARVLEECDAARFGGSAAPGAVERADEALERLGDAEWRRPGGRE